jgi:H+/Cl- antiporter ClcA
MMLAVSATIGALFSTPVAAALVFTGIVGAAKSGGALWDRLFLPLVAAGAGAVTMRLLGAPSLALDLPAYGEPRAIDLLTGTIVAALCVGLTLLAVLVFPHLHRAFHRLGHPLLYVGLGGVVLGILGAIGGPLTLFKGLHQMAELTDNRADYDASQLAVMALVKIAALLVAAASGFRGGRIFPAVFIGVALGLLANILIPDLPISLAVACAVLGVVLVVARDGWMALFVAVMVSGDVTVLPVMCLIILPLWLMVTRAPEMIVRTAESPTESPA